jgi:hypothetical protein
VTGGKADAFTPAPKPDRYVVRPKLPEPTFAVIMERVSLGDKPLVEKLAAAGSRNLGGGLPRFSPVKEPPARQLTSEPAEKRKILYTYLTLWSTWVALLEVVH